MRSRAVWAPGKIGRRAETWAVDLETRPDMKKTHQKSTKNVGKNTLKNVAKRGETCGNPSFSCRSALRRALALFARSYLASMVRRFARDDLADEGDGVQAAIRMHIQTVAMWKKWLYCVLTRLA